MFVHPQFDPVAFSVGPLSIRWYGLAYLVGFALFWLLGRYRARQAWRGISIESVEDLLFYGMLGVIVGGRLGFCFFYQPQWFLAHPADILKVWQGGMSAHGGMLGVIAASKQGHPFYGWPILRFPWRRSVYFSVASETLLTGSFGDAPVIRRFLGR